MKTNKEYRDMAYKAMSGNWGVCAAADFIYVVIAVALSSINPEDGVFQLLILIALMPMAWGVEVMFLDIIREKKYSPFEWLIEGYRNGNLWRVLGTTLLQSLYIYLWTLCLIIPGFIKNYSYIMTPFVLLDQPELKFDAAIERSMQLMKGYKWKFFCLQLSFIGWVLLSMLTLGIGFLFLIPYMQTAAAFFYEDLKAEHAEKTAIEA